MPPREHRLPGHAEQDRTLLAAQVEHVRHQTEPRLPAVRSIRPRERRIQWLTPPQTIEGAEGEPIQVSNTRWQDTIWDEWRTEYDDAYIEDWNDGYEAAINDMLNDGIDTTTGIRRR